MDDRLRTSLGAALSCATSQADRGLTLIKAGIGQYAAEDLSAVDNRALLDDVVAIHIQIEALRAQWLARIGEIDRREAAVEEEGAASTAAWLRGACLIPGGSAAAAVRVARRLRELPGMAAALGEGRIGFDAAQLISRALSRARLERAAAAGLTPDTIDAVESAVVELAETTDPVRLRGELAKVVEHLDAAPTDTADSPERDTGSEDQSELYASKTLDDVVHVTGRFDALDGAVLLAALDAASAPVGQEDARTPAQRRAAGLIDLLNRALAGGELPANGGELPHVGVLVPVEMLTGTDGRDSTRRADSARQGLLELCGVTRVGDRHAGAGVQREGGNAGVGRCAHLGRLADTLRGDGRIGSEAWLTQTGPISAAAARLLACDATVHRIVLGPDSIPLDVGRSVRIVPAPLRRALLVRDRGCAFPGCDRPPSWCQAHHITHWADGGPTSLDNCVLLCRFHHWLLHNKGWQVHAVPGGRPYFTRPDGMRYDGPRLPRAG